MSLGVIVRLGGVDDIGATERQDGFTEDGHPATVAT